jgi:hypothetical protein
VPGKEKPHLLVSSGCGQNTFLLIMSQINDCKDTALFWDIQVFRHFFRKFLLFSLIFGGFAALEPVLRSFYEICAKSCKGG